MLINKKAVKELILARGREHHGDQFTRVSSTTFLEMEARLTQVIDEYVAKHPKQGKTFIVYKPEAV